MEERKKCLCDSSDVRVVTCSGTSNVGQIGNQAALELAKAKVAGFFCLAGWEPISSPVQCAAKTLQHAEIEPAIR